ncbi:MAG: hypothetical protein P1P88_22290, partial [Bacteroidales bacterium]|nr:hypothetical protein [Bacteroidales bacterium]
LKNLDGVMVGRATCGNPLILHSIYNALHPKNKTKKELPNTFEIAGEDGNYYPAKTLIDGEQLILSSAKVKAPKSARYAYYENSVGLLFNEEGLPASSFSTEEKLVDL